ncbi:MAG: Rnase Y domain-containing protein, partial [Acutalibacteraceae bacterium]
MDIPIWIAVVIGIVCLAVGVAVAGPIAFKRGIEHRRREAEGVIGSAETEAERIKKDAQDAAERRKKEALLEAKDEIHRLRSDAEREMKDRRRDVQRQENRLQQKEETLDRKIENYEKKEEQIAKRQKDIEAKLADVENLKKSQFEMLERISGFTVEQAKDYLLNNLTEELTHEKAVCLNEMEAQLKEEADARARSLISQAIQRVAADQVAEATVSVVPLPND